MKILGPALITNVQQKMLAEGAHLEVGRNAVYESAVRRAKIGDRFWVRESYVLVTPRQFGCPQTVHTILYGHSPTRMSKTPDYLKPWIHLCRRRLCDGSTLSRSDSRASLEIISPTSDGWRCRVHMGNVDGLESEAA